MENTESIGGAGIQRLKMRTNPPRLLARGFVEEPAFGGLEKHPERQEETILASQGK